MSENEQPAAVAERPVNEALQEGLNAYGTELLRECTQLDGAGNQIMAIPFAQLLCDVRVLQVKLAVILHELDREQLVEAKKVTERLIRELALETHRLKQVIAARPKVAIASGVVGGINGRNRG